jgi:hypothetical protein
LGKRREGAYPKDVRANFKELLLAQSQNRTKKTTKYGLFNICGYILIQISKYLNEGDRTTLPYGRILINKCRARGED